MFGQPLHTFKFALGCRSVSFPRARHVHLETERTGRPPVHLETAHRIASCSRLIEASITFTVAVGMPLRLLEHVILKITDADVARSFYSALGAVVSPVNSDDESSLDVNVGASQVRLCLQPCGGDAVLSWPGCISVWSREELGNVWARVQTLAASHAACSPGCWHTSANLSSSDAVDCTLCVTCPWGNKFLIKRAPEGLTDDPEGARPGGTGTLISLTSLEHFVRPGAAAPLHAFWSQTFGADAASLKGMHDDARIQQCRVHMISGQRLLFTESPNAPLVAD